MGCSAATAERSGAEPRYDTSTADGDGLAVDPKLVDVAAPALGLASIPSFTQFTSQRVNYAGVDNKSGVASYDVRWQRGSPHPRLQRLGLPEELAGFDRHGEDAG